MRIDLTAQTAPQSFTCSCQPALVAQLSGTGVFRVTSADSGPAWMVDASASTPTRPLHPGHQHRIDRRLLDEHHGKELMRRLSALSGLLGLLLSVAPAQSQSAPGATSVSPTSVPAGTGALSVTLGGNFPLADRGVYTFCVVSGGTASKIAPTSITTTSAVVPLPATTVQVAPSYFEAGVAVVQISLATRLSICTYPASGSNVAMQILYPTITSASLVALQQNNLTPGPASVPNRIEVLGSNFIAANTYATISIDSSYASGHLTADVITSGSLTFARPAVKDLGLSNLTIQTCNVGGTYSYCSLSSNPVIPLYAPAKPTVTASATPASVLPGGSSNLSATIATPGSSQTPGGNFVPGAPGGTVTFKDTTAGTTLGSVKVTPSALAFTISNAQPLSITTGGFHPDGSPTLLTSLVADFNQDGVPDTLVIQNTEATMQLFLGGSPAGNLQPAQTLTFAGYCYSVPAVTVGDFNGDGYPDIAYLCGDSGGGSQIYLGLNNGDGTFPSYYGYYVGDAGSATQLAAGYFNGDTNLDLVATGQTNSSYSSPAVYGIETFFGSGGSQPTFTAGPVTTTTDIPGTQLVAADLNNDKYTDIALLHTSASGVGTIQPYQNSGKGVFTATTAIPVSAAATRLIARPFTANTTYPDLAVVEPGVGIIVALNKRATATSFSTPVQTALPKLTDAIFADFDGDGISDLAYYDSSAVHVLSGKGNGNFSGVFGQTLTQANLVLQVAPDLNADGHADLVVYEHNGVNSEFVFNNIVSAITTGTGKATLPVTFANGTHNITATYSGNIDLIAGSGTTSVIAGQATPTITWNPPATATTTTLINATYLNATASVPGTFAYTPAPGSYLASGAQTLTAVFGPTDSVTYMPVTTMRTVTVATSAISTFTIAATPVPQTYHSGVPTVVTITLNGTHFAPTGTVQFFDGSAVIGSADVAPGSGGTSVASLTLLSISTGSHAFGATYSGDKTYGQFIVPTSRYITYTVGKAVPILTWTPNPQTIAYGAKLTSAQLDAVAKDASGATILGTFVYEPGIGTLLDAGEHSISVTFNPADTTEYSSATDNASVIVSKFTPVITWTAPASIPYGTALSATQLDAVAKDINGATVPGAFSYAPASGSIPNVGTTQDTATFNPSNTQDFNTATKTVPIVVTSGPTTTILQITPNPTIYGQPVTLKAIASDATGAPLAGVVTFTDQTRGVTLGQATLTGGVGSFTYPLPATGTHSISVAYPGDATHLASTGGPISLTVGKAAPTLTWNPSVPTITYGTALSSSQLNAAASFTGPASLPNIPGTFTYSPTFGAILTAGTHTLNVSFFPNDTTNFETATASTVITVTKAAPALTWPVIAPITQGSMLTATQLGAMATGVDGKILPGTFAYNPQLGTVLGTGLQTLTVSYTPTDTVDYSNVGTSNTVRVLAATTTIVTAAPNPAYAGQSVTFTATIAHAGTAAATGSATFFDGSAQLGIASVSNNTSSFTTSALAVGNHAIHVVYAGDTNYATSTSASITETIVVNQVTVTWNPAPATISYGTPLGAGQLDATAFDPLGNPLSGTFTYTPALTDVLKAGTQTLSVVFTPGSPFAPVTKTATITVIRIAPTITWPTPAAINQGTALSATQLNATATGLNEANLPGIFTYTPASGTILQPGAQTLNLSFAPADSVDYLPATASRSIQVNNALTTTTLTSTPNPSTFGQTVTVTASVAQTGTETAALTGTVTFRDTTANTQLAVVTLTAGNAAFTTSTLTTGSHAITATYSGDTNYVGSTTPTALTQVVGAGVSTITWNPNPTTISYGTPLSATQLDAVAKDSKGVTIPGTFLYSQAVNTILPAGSQTLNVNFTPTDTSSFKTATAQTTITVTKATPVITWPAIAAITQGTALSATQLDASVKGVDGLSLPGTFTYTPAAGIILQTGTQPLSLLFIPSDLTDYVTATGTNSVVVNKAATTTTVASSLNPANFGQSVTLTATVGRTIASTAILTGSITFAEGATPLGTAQLSTGSASVTLSSLSAGTHVITVSYSGDASNVASQGQITQVVNTSGSTITWSPVTTSISYGTALGSSELNAVARTTAGVTIPGTFAYTPASGVVLDAGSQVLNVTFTPTDTINFKTATAETIITITKGTPSIAWPAPAAIPQGTALSATQLNAAATYLSAAVPGTYTYTPAAGTIPHAGVLIITLLFTPTNLTNFNPVTTTNSVSVTQSATSTAVTTTANPSSAGRSVTITATVTRGDSSTSPLTGKVTFSEGSKTYGTIPVASGTASLTISNLTVGSHSITATYTGDANDLSSQGHLTQVIDTITPVITWTPTTPTLSYGTALGIDQLNAIAKDAAGVEIQGTYTYTPPSGTLLDVGRHTLTVLFTPAVTATYTTVTASTTITVQQATVSTTLAITSGGSPVTTIATGAAATLTASVSAGTTPLSTGQVNFCDATVAYCTDIHLFGTAQLTSAGTASIKLSPGIGSHSYKAVYLPTTDYASSASSAVPLTVLGRYATSTKLAEVGDVGNYKLTATTTGFANPAAAPTGAITFVDTTNSNATLGKANLGNAIGAVSFGVSESPTTGTGYQFTATGDFNGDGKLDLAVINRYENTVTIMLGKGDGTFTVGSVAPTGGMPQLIGVGDFNGDGIIDLAVTNFDDNTVSVFVGKGDGTFTVASTPSIGTSGSPVGIAIADFNGDGKADIAVPTQDNQTVSILLGNGDGTFVLSSSAPAIGKTPFVVVTGDLNNDGRADLAVANFNSNSVTILLGNGDGTFKASNPIATGNNPLALSLGDFNADGKLDLAIPNFGDGTIDVLLGKGDGTFGPASTITVGKSPYSVAVGDFNGDGKLDIAVPNAGDNTVSVLIGHGDGSFTTGSLTSVGGYPSYISVGDLNGDGDTDLAIANQATGPAVSILLAQLTQTATASVTGISPLHIGTPQHAVVAVYPGDTNFNPSTSTPVDITEQSLLTPIIHWTPAVGSIPYGVALGAQQLNATVVDATGATIPGIITYTPTTGAILAVGTDTLGLSFIPTDTLHFASATATTAITITKAATTTTIASGVNPTNFGQSTTLTATVIRTTPTASGAAPLTGSVTFTDGTNLIGTAALKSGVTTLPIATLTVGSHLITATYSGDVNDVVSSRQLTQQVNTIATNVTWSPVPATIVYGKALTSGQLDAVATNATGASVPGKFTYSANSGDILNAGSQTLTATFTPTDAAHDASARATATINVTRATPTITWPTPATINQGTALSSIQLDATVNGVTGATLPGAVTYTPAPGTILSAGVHTLSVTFVPTDTVDYTNATATVSLTVRNGMTQTALTSTVNPSQYGQPTNLVATIVHGGTLAAVPTGSVNFFDGTRLLGTSPLTATGTATLTVSNLTAGAHSLTAAYSGDTANAPSTSTALAQIVNKATAVVTFAPNPSSIVYGTALSAAQLDATVTSLYVPTVPGAFAYTPATGAVLSAGTTSLSTTFTPTDTANFIATTQTASLTVTRATPTVTFPTPPYTVVGSTLSATQLNASATGVTGATLPGTFTYSPAAGSIVVAGPQVLTVTFTPADTTNYATAKATTTLNGTAVTLTSLDSTKASLGDKAKTITLTGTGFVSDSVARSNGAALATTYVSATTLQAVIPAASLLTVQVLQISVFDPTQNQTTSSIPLTVSAPPVNATISAPPTASPGDQPSITLNLATPYAFPVTAKFSLSFTPASGGIVDPNIQFAGGGQTTTFDVAAGQTTAPSIQIQSGTVAGVIQITLSLSAGGVDVTPAGTAATVINVPAVVPGLSQVAVTGSGRQLTVTTYGFSNTREITQAHFHFTPAAGQQIQTQDITLDVSSIFSGWFTSPDSDAYGSEFLYTQTFTLDDDASVVGQVTVTLSNSIGVSAAGASQ